MPYSEIDKDDLILRDKLAADRTNLSNERTLLAYIRTSVGLLVSGIALLRLFDNQYIHILGYALVLFAILTVCLGFRRYFRVRQILKPLRHDKRNNSND